MVRGGALSDCRQAQRVQGTCPTRLELTRQPGAPCGRQAAATRRCRRHPPCTPQPHVPPPLQIRFVLLLSRQGKVRLAKWYTTLSQKERGKITKEVSNVVLARPAKLCNFVDWKVGLLRGSAALGWVPHNGSAKGDPWRGGRASPCRRGRNADASPSAARASAAAWAEFAVRLLCALLPLPVSRQDQKIVYKRYASLYFIAGIDQGEHPRGGGMCVGRCKGSWLPTWSRCCEVAPPAAARPCCSCCCRCRASAAAWEGRCWLAAALPCWRWPRPATQHTSHSPTDARPPTHADDNELLTLEVIHQFVEVLDKYFGNVCELDLIFNFHKVPGWGAARGRCCLGGGPHKLQPCLHLQLHLQLDSSCPPAPHPFPSSLHPLSPPPGLLHPGRAAAGGGAAGDEQEGGEPRDRGAGPARGAGQGGERERDGVRILQRAARIG